MMKREPYPWQGYINIILSITCIILLIILFSRGNGSTSITSVRTTLTASDTSCGIVNPCQVNVKIDGQCDKPLNKPAGTPCVSECVSDGVCTYDYSKSSKDGSVNVFCNATSPAACRGFCNSYIDCPIPKFINGLESVGILCLKSNDLSSIGTCIYFQRYAEFYDPLSKTINWFLTMPAVSYVGDSVTHREDDVCHYIILNPKLDDIDPNNPDPTFNKHCLVGGSFFYGYDYSDYCMYQYECTRPDNLGTTIDYRSGGTLDIIADWIITNTSQSTVGVLSNQTRYTNLTTIFNDFLLNMN
jgi:hypothetical protein